MLLIVTLQAESHEISQSFVTSLNKIRHGNSTQQRGMARGLIAIFGHRSVNFSTKSDYVACVNNANKCSQ